MAISFVNSNLGGASSTSSISVNQITGIQNNDIIFALIARYDQSTINVPSGFSLIDTNNYSSTTKRWLYYKIASNESGTYDWTWSTSTKSRVDMMAWRGGFNISDPIDSYTNTAYTSNDVVLRAWNLSVTNIDSPILFFGSVQRTLSTTLSAPSSPYSFTSRVSTGDTLSDFWQIGADYIWSSSGTTDIIDGSISASIVDKHAFAVSLNPSIQTSTKTLFFGRQFI